MALQVGELSGIITIDDRAMDPALRRAENALREAGQRMGDDAGRAGRQAGEDLGEGVVRGADGELSGLQRRFVAAVDEAGDAATREAHQAGEDAGGALGDGIESSGGAGAESAAAGIGDKLKGGLAGAAAGIGLAVGAVLMDALGQAMEQGKITTRLGAQLGKTPAEAQRFGKVAGQLYADAITEDFQGAADTISAVMGSGLLKPNATNAQIESISTKVADLASTFDQDLGGVTNAVSQLMRTGLAKNANEAFDLIAAGFGTSANKADDFLDTINEYSVQFKRVGLDGKTAFGLIDQAIKGGARDSDQVADALGQFGELAIGQSKGVQDAFKSIGLDSDAVASKLKKGGKSGQQALQMTLDALRGTKDETTKLNAATALFGDPGTVMGDALFAMDPAGAAASSGMDKAEGSAGKLGDTIRDNAAVQIEQFKRGAMQRLVTFLGGTVVPGLLKFRGAVRKTFGSIWAEAGKDSDDTVDRIGNFFTILGQRLVQKGRELAPKAIAVLQGVGQKVADYVVANPEQVFKITAIATALIAAIAALPLLLAGALTAAATSMMVGFGERLVSSGNENLRKWWASFTAWVTAKAAQAPGVFNSVGSAIGGWFSGLWSRYISGPVSRQWNSFIGTVSKLPGRATGALARLGGDLAASANAHWQRFQTASAARGTALIGWVRGLPGRISGGIGSLGNLLYSKGQNVVQGLWSGIQSMGGWIQGQIMSWARNVIPGPIAKALGIASPSKVTKAQGRWIARGLIAGLTGSTKQVKAAATKLADIVADSMNPGKKRSAALSRISKDSKKLVALANKEAQLATRMKTASKKLADLIKSRDKLAADVKKGVLDSANITQQDTGGWPQTAESILAGLRADTQAAQTFAKNLATLRKKGVRADLIAQIAQAGVEQGSASAAALATANSSQIGQINSQQAALVKAAGQAGSVAGNAMYGAGIDAANGLIKGLKKQQGAIEKQMLKIAKGMSSAIRKALGIKSPSKVMALVGSYTGQGLRQGIEGERAAVNRSMASLVDTPTPGAYGWAGGAGGRAGGKPTVLEIRSSGSSEDNYLVERLRRGIRKKGGGDVDLVLAGKRGG